MNDHLRDHLYFPPLGSPKYRLPTPALLIELQALEFNLKAMSNYFNKRSTKLRPHFKTHKCPRIAQKQVDYGAIGITCAKLSEAEVLVNSGIKSILIANQVVDPGKITRLAELAESCQIIVAVDNLDNLRQIDTTSKNVGTKVNVVIEVDVGLHRAGVQPGVPALTLAKEASNLAGINFSGLLGYEGFTMFETNRDVRRRNSQLAMESLVNTGELIRQEGIPVEIISAGGTGTYDLTGDFPGVTEVEAGSYVFMDSKYNQLGLGFKQSLTLLAMVTSVHDSERCIIDAGIKALTTDNGIPKIQTPDGLELYRLNEEHGVVRIDPDMEMPVVGSCVEIIPSHGCTTVNLHDRYYVIQDERLVDIWEISGRGKSQ
jgi:D-serine deaminase-like pyridoxal phosphate-dependent protein